MNPPAAETEAGADAFRDLDEAFDASGPAEAIDRLASVLVGRGQFRAYLDALLLRARLDLGLPPVQVGSLNDLPEPARTDYEARYVEAIRSVGRLLLDRGDIAAAWPYFRVIGENEPVAAAIAAFEPTEADERLGQVVDIAFNQGVSPRRGFELILEHYGTCSAITAFESLPPDEATRIACADALARQLHAHLGENLRAEIARRGQPSPPEGASIPAMIEGRDWLFGDDSYHIDVSHLASVVRFSPLLVDPATIEKAVELTEYGRRLSNQHRYEGEPPFEDLYADHGVYLRALLGRDEAAVAHFRAKLTPADPDVYDDAIPAQVLVRLLTRLNRLDEAVEVAAEYLAGRPEASLGCPSLPQLCVRTGRFDVLARASRERDDLVNYAAALLQIRSS